MENKKEIQAVAAFQYYLPVNIVFGNGCVNQVGELARPYGRKALIVTGGNSAKRSGLYDRVKGSLEANGMDTVLFDQVKQNPLTTTAMDGAELAKSNHCEVIVAVGGGSVMDCAKAISLLAVNDGDINDYIFNRLHSDHALPLILIPTTCGTGSEGNGCAVLTNPETGDKKSLFAEAVVAKASIVDPECMKTMPKHVLASVGFDALCHNMEAYTSKTAQPFTDALSLYAISLIADSLVKVYENPEDQDAWTKMSLASTIGGMVIHTAGITIPHAMEHPASGLRDIVHGKGLAAITPVAIESSYTGDVEKFGNISRLLGGTSAEDCAKTVRGLLKKLDLDCGLSDLGITETDVEWMAANCVKVSGAGIANNPVAFSQEEIARLYSKAL